MKISRRNTMKLTKSQLKQMIKEELTSKVNKINEAMAGIESRMKKISPAGEKALAEIGDLLKTKSPQIKVEFLLQTLLPMVGITPEDTALLASKLGTAARKEPEVDPLTKAAQNRKAALAAAGGPAQATQTRDLATGEVK